MEEGKGRCCRGRDRFGMELGWISGSGCVRKSEAMMYNFVVHVINGERVYICVVFSHMKDRNYCEDM